MECQSILLRYSFWGELLMPYRGKSNFISINTMQKATSVPTIPWKFHMEVEISQKSKIDIYERLNRKNYKSVRIRPSEKPKQGKKM